MRLWFAHSSEVPIYRQLVTQVVLAILCDLEGLAMSVVLPVWRKDVKSIWVAWRVSGEMLKEERGSVRMGRNFVVGATSVLVLGSMLVLPAFAVEAGWCASDIRRGVRLVSFWK